MRAITVLLFCGFILVTYQQRPPVAKDFISDILANVARMNQEIQRNVDAEVARAKGVAADALRKIKSGLPPSLASIKLGKNGSDSHYVSSGKDSKGRPYYIETENVVIGNTLFHTERVYNHTTKRIDERRYTYDLDNPDDPPILTSSH